MAEEVTSDITLFEIDGEERKFRTLTTHENGEVQKTVYQEEIDKSTYEERESSTSTLVSEGDDGLYYSTVVTVTDDEEFTIYADLSFQKEWEETGNNSLESNLNTGSLEALADNTTESLEYWREKSGYSQVANTAEESALDSVSFSSQSVPLTITTSKRRTEYETLFYPEDIASTTQDRIKFSMKYISGNREINFDLSNVNPLSVGIRNTETISGSVTLPIPGGIQDKNSVKFEGENMNLGQAAIAGAALNPEGAFNATVSAFNNLLDMSPKEIENALGSPQAKNIIAALRLGLAQQVSGGNLLSRIGGGILNPNMELLFQAPTLRSFNFSFTMSARSSTEATQIKKIIRFFKQGMSVKKSDDNVFVVSPNIFNIKYLLGDSGDDHPSIGRIKDCALLDLNTTYGNGNTYMTYNDPDRTMTQYKIDMTFQELDPLTEDDYQTFSSGPLADSDEAFVVSGNDIPSDQIGY
jgi:hypothetical protein|tara:strand:- start:65 stop:1471 length:1407 start_codon:yes stop_codon:yes gene_type:complete